MRLHPISAASVLLSFHATLFAGDAPAPLTIRHDLPTDAQVSLLLTAADGTVVRELLHGAPRKRGTLSEAWDGLDEQGQPVPAGTYGWKLLASQGLRSEWLVTAGTNPTPGWESWPGNHGPINAIAVDESGMYAATGCGEGTALAIKQTMDGKRLWTIPHWLEAWGGPTSMASDGGTLFMLHISGKVFRTPTDKAEPKGDAWNLEMADDRKVSVFNGVNAIMDLDAGGGQLVVTYARHDLVCWLDPATGKETGRATVPQPFGVAVDRSDGSVLAISMDRVVRVTGKGQAPVEVVAKGQLVGPSRLSVDPTTGDILVSENWQAQRWVQHQYFSKDHEPPDSVRAQAIYQAKGEGYLKDPAPIGGRQVKRFSRAGKLLATYGALAGSRPGKHDPQNFSGVIDIAATGDGGFIVCEEGLTRRTARFDKRGACVREWFGGWGYGQHAVVDPADPTILWITDRGTFVKTRIDLAKRSWQYLATYRCPDMGQWFNQEGPVWRVVHRGKDTFFALIGWQGVRGPCLIRLDETNARMEICTAAKSDIGHDRELDLMKSTQTLLKDFYATHPKGSFTWSDVDGDGRPALGEMQYSSYWTHSAGWYMDDDFTWWFHEQDDQLAQVNVLRLAPRSWTAKGVPVYHFDDRKVLSKAAGFNESVWRDPDGSVFTSFNHAGLNERNFGIGGWSGRAAMNRVAKHDQTGKLQWVVGRHAAGSGANPGEGHYLLRVAGTTHGCVVVNDMANGWAHVWDRDGLWVGRLFDQPKLGPDSPASAYEQCGENFGGSLFTDPKTKEVFYVGGGINNCPIYRITGWDQFKRASGSVTVTPAIAGALTAKVKAEAARTDVARVHYVDENRLKLDGDLGEWKGVPAISIKDGDATLAKVHLAWNTYYLYAAFDVTTKSPWKNASSLELAFQGGAAVDLNVGPLLPKRDAAQIGDYRVVVAPISGTTAAVEYFPILTKDQSPPHSRTGTVFKTLIGAVTFDRAGRQQTRGPQDPDAVAKPKADGSGYVVEMRVFRRPPLEFAPGFRFRFDASVILADPTGTKSVLRVPWHSRASADGMTQDTFTEAVLRPGNWGEAVLE